MRETKVKLNEALFELQKVEGERDFHHQNHTKLIKQKYAYLQGLYQLENKKRDMFYKEETIEAQKERIQELEQQINELLVFAQKPVDQKELKTEVFYAKKITGLQELIGEVREEIFNIKFLGQNTQILDQDQGNGELIEKLKSELNRLRNLEKEDRDKLVEGHAGSRA